ncbi:hypothetical protein MASR1M45_06810 [Candidatus Kapaibacterium sp.]
MYGLKDLKTNIKKDNISVECPIKGCSVKVDRQRKSFKREQNYQCPIHKIYISPSTFEYETEKENLLWFDNHDKLLFEEIKKVKRESRIARDNSEDALTWNVMRFLDRQGLINDFLSQLSNKEINEAELILWSYSPKEKSNWTLLNQARIEFGETIARGSEPDIIIRTDKVLYFIEAKLTANNETKPSDHQNKKKYETGGNKMFPQIFKSDYETIVIKEKRYELMRFWLLGSWIANQLNVDFEFYSLVMQSQEQEIESEFGKHIIESEKRKFSRYTWEQINDYIETLKDNKEKQKMTDYFENKIIGFSSSGTIIQAFNIAK